MSTPRRRNRTRADELGAAGRTFDQISRGGVKVEATQSWWEEVGREIARLAGEPEENIRLVDEGALDPEDLDSIIAYREWQEEGLRGACERE